MSTNKPRVVIFTHFFHPGYLGGGPIQSISNLINQLSDNFEFFVITSNKDLGCNNVYQNLQSYVWQKTPYGQIIYVDKNSLTPFFLARMMNNFEFDLIYLNSFFDLHFSIVPQLTVYLKFIKRRPILLAPRGEFSPGALALKYMKKKVYLTLYSISRMYNNLYFHASTAQESLEIESCLKKYVNITVLNKFFPQRVFTALDFPSNEFPEPVIDTSHKTKENILSICFLSRISPKKNLHYALNVLKKVKVNVVFNIYGPVEDQNYWALCKKIINDLPNNISINVFGAVEHKHVASVLQSNDLFFLPTKGENFGHVFFEAWSSGVPVLTSDQTPWRNLQELGIGWDFPLSEPDSFINTIHQIALLESCHLNSLASTCRTFAKLHSLSPKVRDDNLNMFNHVLSNHVEK